LNLLHRAPPSEDQSQRFNFDASATWDDTAARAIGARLQEQPGFRSYTVVRTGEWDVVAVTVFESVGQLELALATVADLVREGVRPLAAEAPERREGVVLMHAAA
jgi:hypothetical protein